MIKLHVKNRRNKQRSGKFITLSCGFRSEILAVIGEKEVNAKSIMNTLIIETVEEMDFVITGEDEIEAADAVLAYFENNKTTN